MLTKQETFILTEYLHDLLSCGEKGVPIKRLIPKVKRNDLCPCGSKKKYKKCCLNKNNS